MSEQLLLCATAPGLCTIYCICWQLLCSATIEKSLGSELRLCMLACMLGAAAAAPGLAATVGTLHCPSGCCWCLCTHRSWSKVACFSSHHCSLLVTSAVMWQALTHNRGRVYGAYETCIGGFWRFLGLDAGSLLQLLHCNRSWRYKLIWLNCTPLL